MGTIPYATIIANTRLYNCDINSAINCIYKHASHKKKAGNNFELDTGYHTK